ncbi:3-hydroxybutyryl-CoA dehydrogenase [Klebsiella pneumoniae]|nr:3-hydroxybutyryl-CoA dehydrogenase [Klebsiella pneumoniae]
MFTSRLAVLGAGLMGVGIACHFARHGHAVRLYDTDPQRLAEVPAVASAILCELEACGQQDPADRDAVLARLTPTPTLNALADATLLIEAIPERLALKHALYAELETLIADEAIIASNTSGLPPDQLAQGMRLPERLLIAHFWHPPHLIPLVEVVPGSATLPSSGARGERLLRRLRAGGGGAQPRRAGLCRQPAAVRPAARSVAYRPQRHRFPGGGGPGDARLAGPPLCDGRARWRLRT